MAASGSVRILLIPAFAASITLTAWAAPPPVARDPWLSLPQVQAQVPADSAADFSDPPESIRQIVIHIPAGGSHVEYGTIHTKVNTESTDVVMQSASGLEGIELRIDLTAGSGFPFRNGRNSVEVEYRDQFGRQKYANFLLTFRPPVPPPDPVIPSGPAEKRYGRIFAVVIGIARNNGSDDPGPRYADRDATAFADFLKSPAGGRLTDDTVATLLNEHATTQNIRYALSTFLALAQPQDTILVYIAGQAVPDARDQRSLYLLTADSKPDDLAGTAFPITQLEDVFERTLKAGRVLTIADTYGAYGKVTSAGLPASQAPRANNLVNQYLRKYAGGAERTVITASDISEQSFEDGSLGSGHGVFTYYLLKGLNGEADANHDGAVTIGELYAYLRKTVPQATGGKQNPQALIGRSVNYPLSIVGSSPARHAASLSPTHPGKP